MDTRYNTAGGMWYSAAEVLNMYFLCCRKKLATSIQWENSVVEQVKSVYHCSVKIWVPSPG